MKRKGILILAIFGLKIENLGKEMVLFGENRRRLGAALEWMQFKTATIFRGAVHVPEVRRVFSFPGFLVD